MIGSQIYIKFRDAEIADTKMLSEDAYMDLDKDGNIVTSEIWKASQNAILPISRNIAEKLKLILESSV